MSQPCDGVGFAASCAVLNQVTLTDPIGTNIGQQLFNYIQLMMTDRGGSNMVVILPMVQEFRRMFGELQ